MDIKDGMIGLDWVNGVITVNDGSRGGQVYCCKLEDRRTRCYKMMSKRCSYGTEEVWSCSYSSGILSSARDRVETS